MKQNLTYNTRKERKNLQFNQLVFSFYDQTKSTREIITFECWIFTHLNENYITLHLHIAVKYIGKLGK